MRTAYLDCFCGISGDMFLSAFIDCLDDPGWIIAELDKLHLPGTRVIFHKVRKNGISATQMLVESSDEAKHRSYHQLKQILHESDLPESVITISSKILKTIAKAESVVHGVDISEVHFHEIGGLDTVIDAAGAAILVSRLGIEKLYCSPIHVGSGMVDTAHGVLPVPAPATLEILKGVPIYSLDVKKELTTPTGAAIAKTFAHRFTDMPPIKAERIGYGAGKADLPQIPNLLRVVIGLHEDELKLSSVTLIETNIDDMNPELYGNLMDVLFEHNALDACIIPMIMKKSRPGLLLQVMARKDDVEDLVDLIFLHTSTLGVRLREVHRKTLRREQSYVDTVYGRVKVKKSYRGKEIHAITPEYESVKELANRLGIPMKLIYEEVIRATVPKRHRSQGDNG